MYTYKPLLHILVDRDLNITNVCVDAGVSSKIATKIKNGDNVNIKTLAKIAKYLNVEIGDIVKIE
jgi:DNA-binding Xre family transcriptional regulator